MSALRGLEWFDAERVEADWRSARDALRANFDRKRARAVLKDLWRCDDVAAFRERIVGCVKPKHEIQCALREDLEPTPVNDRATARNYLKKVAAKVTGDGVKSCDACGAPFPSGSRVPTCACKRVHYCDSSCQRNHWPVHKVTCTSKKKS